MRTCLAILVAMVLGCSLGADGPPCPKPCCTPQTPKVKITDQIKSMSVTVDCEEGGGSGTILHDKAGDVWVLTAAHVVREDLWVKILQVRGDKNGKERIFWTWGKVEKVEPKEDIALIHVGRFLSTPAKLYCEDEPPDGETPIIACGSYGDRPAPTLHHSISRGTIVAIGRPYPPFAYKDQIDITAWYGSSGGGVFLEDGRFVGIVTHGIPRNGRVIYMTPVRRILEWAGKQDNTIRSVFGMGPAPIHWPIIAPKKKIECGRWK